MTTVKTDTRCDIVDQILAWATPEGDLNVEVGDLVVDDGQFKQLDYVALEGSLLVGYRHLGVDFAKRDELVAVRRYIETSEGSVR